MLNLCTIDSSITKDVIISGIQNNSKNNGVLPTKFEN